MLGNPLDVHLTPTEYALLARLVRQAGQVVTPVLELVALHEQPQTLTDYLAGRIVQSTFDSFGDKPFQLGR